MNKNRVIDIGGKLFLFAAMILIIGLNYNLNYMANYYIGSSFEGVKVYSAFSENTLTFFTMAFLLVFYYFLNVFKSSHYKTSWIEKPISKVLNLFPSWKVNHIIYSVVVITLPAIFIYVIIDSVIMMSLSASLIAEIDYTTYEKLPIYGYSRSYTLIYLFIALFFFFMSTKPSKKIKADVFYGAFVLHTVLSTLFGLNSYKLSDELSSMDISLQKALGTVSVNVEHFIFVASILLTLIYLFSLYNAKTPKKISIKIGVLFGSYLLSRVFMVGAGALALTSEYVEMFQSNLNDREVVIAGQTYQYNTSLLEHDSNKENEAEFLIESYVGQSMHNSSYAFNFIFSDDYQGDKEKAYQLYAKIYKRNSEIFEKSKDQAYSMLQEGVNMTDAINILIPFIINESMPYSLTKEVNDAILEKDYQKAVDTYIEKVLNNKSERISVLTKEPVKTSPGTEMMQNLIQSIIENDFATMDLNKIENPKMKEIWQKNLEKPIYSYSRYSDEIVNEWFKIFDIK